MHKNAQQKKTIVPYFVAFLIPVMVMVLVFIQRGIFPFGERSFLRTDLYHQYAPFHQMMQDALFSGESLTYTWDIGLGTNMLSLYAYYLASPLNWLLFFWPAKYVIEFITYGIVFKMALASVSFTYYLKKHCNKDSWTPILFGILYSLSGYYAAYSWNTMWLDCLYLFPLVMLGVESLIKEKRFFLYTWSLALCILTNYYISIMVCIFLVIYFFVEMIIHSESWAVKDLEYDDYAIGASIKNFFTRGMLFAFFSLLAGGIASILLLPVYEAFDLTASSNTTFPTTLTSYFSVFDMLSRHLIDIDIHLGLDHWPNIFCGVGTLVMLPLYVLNKSVKPKEKVLYFSLLLFLLLSFSLNVLNYIWHGFHYPNSLPARQSFIYIFLMLVMAYKGFLAIRQVKSSALIASFAGVAAFAILAEKLMTEDFLEWDACYLTIVFAGVYTILAWLYQKRSLTKDILLFLTFTVISLEMTINTSETSVTTINRTSYVKEDSHMDALIDVAMDLEDNDFFRMEKFSTRTKNDGAWIGYHSGSIFSSSANANLTAFYKKMGMEGSTNSYSMNGSTLFMDCFLGVRYATSTTMQPSTDLQKLCSQTDLVNLYANTYALPLGFLVDPDTIGDGTIINSTPITNQNNFAEMLTGITNLFSVTGSTRKTNNKEIQLETQEEGYIYVYVSKGYGIKSVTVTEDNGSDKTYSNLNRGYLIDLGYRTVGDIITFSTEDEGTFSLTPYILSETKLQQAYNILSRTPMVVDDYSNTHVSAHIDSARDGLLLTTIPMEKSWHVFVDGVEIEPEMFMEAFISIPITAGSHTLEFRYEVAGFQTGILLSGSCLGVFLLLSIIVYGFVRPFSSKRKTSPLIEEDSDLDSDDLEDSNDFEYNEDLDSDNVELDSDVEEDLVNTMLDPDTLEKIEFPSNPQSDTKKEN